MSGRGADDRNAPLQELPGQVEGAGIAHPAQREHGRPLHFQHGIPAKAQEQPAQGSLTHPVGAGQEFRAPADRLRPHRRVLVIHQPLHKAEPVRRR